MIYSMDITTAASPATTQVKPKVTELVITKGLIYRVDITFPQGSAGLLGLAVFDGSYQVWPSTLGQWFRGDGIAINFDDVYIKNSAPFKFLIHTYNDDDTYPHIVNVRIGQVSKEIYMARFLPHMAIKFQAEVFAELQEAQRQEKAKQQDVILDNPFPFL